MEVTIGIANIENKDEINQIKEVIKDAFTTYNNKTQKREKVKLRSDENIISLIKECSDGAKILRVDGKIEGVIFCHVLGDFGWFGPLAVREKNHGKGYGKLLVKEALSYFKNKNIKNIKLATMVDAPWNISLYTKLGFKIKYPKVHMVKVLISNNETNLYCEEFDKDKIKEHGEKVLEFLKIINKDKFLKINIDNYINSLDVGVNKIFLVKDEKKEVVALGIYSNNKYNDEIENKMFILEYLFYKNEEILVEVLKAIENYSRSKLKVIFSIPVNGEKMPLINNIMNKGYKISNLSQVMEHCDTVTEIEAINKIEGLLG